MHWLLHVLGIDTQQSYFYDFWSGIGAKIDILILGVLIVLHRCDVDGCYRWAHHQVGHYKVCRKHTPHLDKKITPEVITDAARWEAKHGRH